MQEKQNCSADGVGVPDPQGQGPSLPMAHTFFHKEDEVKGMVPQFSTPLCCTGSQVVLIPSAASLMRANT